MTSPEAARIAFAGTPEFALPSLESLLSAGYPVDPVLTQPDRPAGRGRRLTPSPVKQLAKHCNIGVWQPERLDETARHELPADRPVVLVVVAYGLILPQWMLDWPEVAAINVHASLLPRWRGASPIQQAILADDAETGVSIMRLAPGLDSGPVYGRRAIAVDVRETAGALHDRLAVLGASLLTELLPGILSGRLRPVPQDETRATYAPKIDKREAELDWSESAEMLARRVRAFNPWPVAETHATDGPRLRIWQAEALAGRTGQPPGTVVGAGAGGIDVATGAGILRLVEMQASGGRPMSAAAWIAGHDSRGLRFGRKG